MAHKRDEIMNEVAAVISASSLSFRFEVRGSGHQAAVIAFPAGERRYFFASTASDKRTIDNTRKGVAKFIRNGGKF